MRKNSLGDRMKEYERTSDVKLVRRLPMIVRLDGKAFHSWTKKSGCVRPFDHTCINMMSGLAQYLCENIGGAELAYGQSDEISILVRDDQNIDTDAWFDKRLQKVVSIVASLATYWFNANNAFERKLPAFFDARAFILPEYEVRNYFIWRQEDATTNGMLVDTSVSAYSGTAPGGTSMRSPNTVNGSRTATAAHSPASPCPFTSVRMPILYHVPSHARKCGAIC